MQNYKNFLNLPKTKFSMKANLHLKEIEILDFWKKNNIYDLLENVKCNKKKYFFLHDGPPYANGKIHIGHALNKILKDIILKYKRMSGFKAPYVPCWDCHGLPIELMIEKISKNKALLDQKVFRNICTEYVLQQTSEQKKDFIRLGIFADWNNKQTTMQYHNEANTINTLSQILKKGYIYQDLKPIYWCIQCQSSLAEAEVEYINKYSLAGYINFPVINFEKFTEKSKNLKLFIETNINKVSIIIFTTTIWTLPTCQAIAVNPKFIYQIIQTKNQYYILEKTSINRVMNVVKIKKWTVVSEILGKKLEFLKCLHPIFNISVPIILSNHVKSDIGTGLVHMSPDHGLDDFIACKKYNIKPINIINSKGQYQLPNYEKIHKRNIFNINTILLELLKKNNKIYHLEKIKHKYPHCWRHKIPTIFRATPQWFIRTSDTTLKKNAIIAIKKVSWIPNWGKEKMIQMINNRPDWCIPRQRKWGVPITFIINKKTGQLHKKTYEIMQKLLHKIKKRGSQIWWDLDLKK